MNAYIITIGDEILIGQTLNTNAAFIGELLTQNQINVIGSSVIPDKEKNLLDEFKRVFGKHDLILVTGGLGPTHDDITRKCIVRFFKTKLAVNNDVLNDIKHFFEARGRTLSKTNKSQALVPKNAVAIRNNRGTAPGYWIEKNKKIFIAMPGIPYEMKGMMENFVMPKILHMQKKKKYVLVTNFYTTGIPESVLFDKLGNIDNLLNGARLAFLPSQFGVKMRLTVEAENEINAFKLYNKIKDKFYPRVGNYIFSETNEYLENIVANLLIEKELKLSLAESCTGGLIANRLTNISGSSNFFERGIITYSNLAKVEELNISEDIILKYGAVSSEVAEQMAIGIKNVSNSDLGLAVTGIMGPTGATPSKPIGLVFIGLYDGKKCYVKEFRFGDDRILNKDRTSQAALEMLRRYLLGIPYEN